MSHLPTQMTKTRSDLPTSTNENMVGSSQPPHQIPALPPQSPSTSCSTSPLPDSLKNLKSFEIIHFNAHKSLVVTHEILIHMEFDVIALQELGINPFTFQPLPHQAWNLYTQYDYRPTGYHSQP
ncbi:hypothetical protein CROQUDRAFT_705484 [Cronartium quercuum f. sp. fusiforme G11]|uniref:Endonuclease/exonuclease/phosphatase domain-containing protein n=1 Tax=Cronartium quercuum f. sp. fusiforme G11 TaxID=708437 RepID=A0A9P6NEY4_9BASI|nr:hypothetical protein CROQUDRAFT_705484 [Cronartium quercuum f. sp. fusiforme G11]